MKVILRCSPIILIILALPAFADMLIDGQVANPRQWSVADLKAQAPVTIETSYLSGHGEEHVHFTGVSLWTVLNEAKLIEGEGKHANVRHSILAVGSDNYAVAVSLGEIDPEFEGKQVLIAYERDGKPLDGLQLVMPGDKRGGRYVHDLVHLEVK